MKRRQIIYLLLIQFLLQGCPFKEEQGYEPDTPIYIKNTSADSVLIRARTRSSLESSDKNINDTDVKFLFNELSNLSKSIHLAPNEVRHLYEISKEGKKNSPIGDHYFFVSLDTLLNYTPETWDRKAGVKYYYLYSLEDYERINFTFKYP